MRGRPALEYLQTSPGIFTSSEPWAGRQFFPPQCSPSVCLGPFPTAASGAGDSWHLLRAHGGNGARTLPSRGLALPLRVRGSTWSRRCHWVPLSCIRSMGVGHWDELSLGPSSPAILPLRTGNRGRLERWQQPGKRAKTGPPSWGSLDNPVGRSPSPAYRSSLVGMLAIVGRERATFARVTGTPCGVLACSMPWRPFAFRRLQVSGCF